MKKKITILYHDYLYWSCILYLLLLNLLASLSSCLSVTEALIFRARTIFALLWIKRFLIGSVYFFSFYDSLLFEILNLQIHSRIELECKSNHGSPTYFKAFSMSSAGSRCSATKCKRNTEKSGKKLCVHLDLCSLSDSWGVQIEPQFVLLIKSVLSLVVDSFCK